MKVSASITLIIEVKVILSCWKQIPFVTLVYGKHKVSLRLFPAVSKKLYSSLVMLTKEASVNSDRGNDKRSKENDFNIVFRAFITLN